MSEQQTIEWYIERLGRITASDMHRVLGRPAVRQTYYNELLAEREALVKGHEAAVEYVQATATTARAMEYGKRMEDRARAAYELMTDTDVQEVGFIKLATHEQIGCSLDGLVPNGTVEIKCPLKEARHIANVRYGAAAEHLPQIQAGLWITSRLFCDFISYHPGYAPTPLYIERIERDPDYISMMEKKALEFALALDKRAPLPEYSDVPEAVPILF